MSNILVMGKILNNLSRMLKRQVLNGMTSTTLTAEFFQ